MKTIICVLFSLSVSLVTMVAGAQEYVVTDEPINVRSGPGTNYAVKFQLHKNAIVEAMRIQNSWVDVRYRKEGGEQRGWMHVNFLSPAEPKVVEPSVDVIALKLNCLPTGDSEQHVEGCLLDLDLAITAPDRFEAANVSCNSILTLHSGSSREQIEEVGHIRTPIKNGQGAARMQLMIFPQRDYPVSEVTLNEYHCEIKAV